jgi:RNA polymerase sigma-70 factor (ECF subfamily)
MPSDPVVQFLEERTAERFDVAVRETYSLVYKAAYRVLHDDDRAKDVTQEVFSKLWAGELPHCSVRSGLALLRGTASHVACSTHRAERVRAAEELDEKAVSHNGSDAFTRDDVLDVVEAVRKLPKRLSDCIVLHFYAGFSRAEVAEALEIHEDTARRRIADGVMWLRNRLGARVAILVSPVLNENLAAWTTIRPPADLLVRLREIPRRAGWPRAPARRAARSLRRSASLGPRVAVPAAALLFTAGTVAFYIATSGGGGDAPAARGGAPELAALPAFAVPAPRDPGSPVAGRAAAEPVARSEDGAGDASGRAPAPRAAKPTRGEGGEPAAAPPPALAAEPAPVAPCALEIHVLDERGEPLQEGFVTLRSEDVEAASESAAGAAGLLRRLHVQSLCQPRALEPKNPIVVADIPAELAGLKLTAGVRGLGIHIEEPVAFELEAGKTTSVEVAVRVGPRLEIEVLDRESERPLAGARVTAPELVAEEVSGTSAVSIRSGPSWTASAEGLVLLPGVFSVSQKLVVEAEGYEREEREAGPVGAKLPPERLAVRLRRVPVAEEKLGSLVAVVFGEGGRPVAGTPVAVKGYRWSGERETDGRGVSRFEGLPAGDYLVRLARLADVDRGIAGPRRAGDCRPFATVRVQGGEEAQVRLGCVKGLGSLTIEVADVAGQPIAGLSVGVIAPAEWQYGKSDGSGRAAFTGLHGGEYRVTVEDRGRWSLDKDLVALEAAERRHLRVVVGREVVRGRVLDAKGSPAAGATVTLRGKDGKRSCEVRCDAEGRFEVTRAFPGRYEVTAATFRGPSSKAREVEVRRGKVLEVELRIGEGI